MSDTDKLIAPVLAWARTGQGTEWVLSRAEGVALADALEGLRERALTAEQDVRKAQALAARAALAAFTSEENR